MSDDYTHVGTVRRRPRPGHQRSHSAGNGKPNGANGTYNKHAGVNHEPDGEHDPNREFQREQFYDRAGEARRPRTDPGGGGGSRRSDRPQSHDEAPRKEAPNRGAELEEEPIFRFPFDPWRLYGAVKRNLLWIFCAGLLLSIVGFFVAANMIQYKVSLPLMRKTGNAVVRTDMPVEFIPHQYSEQTLYGFMKSGDLLNSVVEKANADPRIAPLQLTPAKLAEALDIKPTPNPDTVLVTLEVFGGLRPMVDLANLYGAEMDKYMRYIQGREASNIAVYLQGQLAMANSSITELRRELADYSESKVVPFDTETTSAIAELVALEREADTLRQKKELLESKLRDYQGGQGTAVAKTRLDVEKQKLEQLLIDYKPAHQIVVQQKALIERLEARPDKGGPPEAASAGAAANPIFVQQVDIRADLRQTEMRLPEITERVARIKERLGGQSSKTLEFEIKKQQLASLTKSRDVLSERQQQAETFYKNALGYFEPKGVATMSSINYKSRWVKVTLLALFAGLAGMFVATGIVMFTEMLDTTLRTPEDITRVTQLPVLASLGDLRKLSPQQQVNWAFRTLTLLRGKLSRDADQALVCGIISANHGEGRSTWVNLLVSAASQRGLRVLTVDTRPTAAGGETPAPEPAPAPAQKSEEPTPAATAKTDGEAINLPDKPSDALNTSVLSTPGKVTEQLQDPTAQPLVHIPLPGWVWSLDRRKQWQRALEQWKDIDNLVIFVELPPACEQESVLLAEHLPQCLWLTGSGMADATETAAHIETLRHARCNLVGAVLNHAPPPFLSSKITRWFGKGAAALLLAGMLQSGMAAEQSTTSAEKADAVAASSERQSEVQFAQAAGPEPFAFSGTKMRQRAKWQERLTFGPGDTMDIHFYGNSALSRTNIFVGPDGRLNYLQANGVVASGLTVDELREKLDALLAEYFPGPVRTIVIPVSFQSKKYFVLGKVNAKGAYSLDRPLTLLEAVARAKGLETGLYQRTTVEMADLGRSFVIRGNEKLPINFERLFLDGDLSQNVSIEPNDYIFFASTGASDIYVLGEVMIPGPLGFVQSATVMTAIADRGGFSEKAFKKRVLVIRGSLDEPETFIVDSGGTLEARFRDFRLQPRDIVYVSRRPWLKAEELLDEAASSFIQGAVTTWAGVNVGPIITSRLLPRSRNQ